MKSGDAPEVKAPRKIETGQERKRVRWKTAAVLLLAAVAATALIRQLYPGDWTMQVMWLYGIWSGAVFGLFWWWLLLSGVSWRTRGRGVLVVALVLGLPLLILRFDAFDGAMVPKFSSRWEHPFWPALVYGIAVAVLLVPALNWKIRGGGLLVLLVSVALGAGLFDFDGFALKHRPAWNVDGPRSQEADQLLQRLQREKARVVRAAGQPSAVRWSQLSPADWLRLKEQTGWERWQREDGLACAVGCTLRVLFRPEQKTLEPSQWPCFRGPLQDGIVRDLPIRTDWTAGSPPPNLWRPGQPVGWGWSSFAVADGRAVTQEQRDGREMVVCYDFRYGTEIWRHTDQTHFESVQGGKGPRATPTIVGRRVYTLGATGQLNCLDLLDGREYWQRNILDDAGADNLSWGMAGSPLVAGHLLFVNAGKGSGKAVIAYDRFSGEIVWAQGNEQAGYAAPVLRRLHNVPQLLIFHGEGLSAYDPDTGRLLWNFPWSNSPKINVALPVVVDNHVFLSSGYTTGSVLLKVDVQDGQWSVQEVWRQKQFRLKFNDAVYKDGYLYGLDETILKCVRWKDGKIMWRRRGSQLGPGGNYGYGQLLLAGETLLITAENGWVSFITATPQRPRYLGGFAGLNRNSGLLDTKGTGWNVPVLHRGRLLMRNEREVACYDLRGQ